MLYEVVSIHYLAPLDIQILPTVYSGQVGVGLKMAQNHPFSFLEVTSGHYKVDMKSSLKVVIICSKVGLIHLELAHIYHVCPYLALVINTTPYLSLLTYIYPYLALLPYFVILIVPI